MQDHILYHWTHNKNIANIMNEGLLPYCNAMYIEKYVFLSPNKEDWNLPFIGDVLLEVTITNQRIRQVENDEMICSDIIPPESIRIITKSVDINDNKRRTNLS